MISGICKRYACYIYHFQYGASTHVAPIFTTYKSHLARSAVSHESDWQRSQCIPYMQSSKTALGTGVNISNMTNKWLEISSVISNQWSNHLLAYLLTCLFALSDLLTYSLIYFTYLPLTLLTLPNACFANLRVPNKLANLPGGLNLHRLFCAL